MSQIKKDFLADFKSMNPGITEAIAKKRVKRVYRKARNTFVKEILESADKIDATVIKEAVSKCTSMDGSKKNCEAQVERAKKKMAAFVLTNCLKEKKGAVEC